MRWYGRIKKMDENRMVKKMFECDLIGVRRVGRPRKRWIDNMRNSGIQGCDYEASRGNLSFSFHFISFPDI